MAPMDGDPDLDPEPVEVVRRVADLLFEHRWSTMTGGCAGGCRWRSDGTLGYLAELRAHAEHVSVELLRSGLLDP